MIVFHLGMLHGGAGTAPGMRRRTVSLRFLGPDVVFDGRPRDERGAQEGNDAALAVDLRRPEARRSVPDREPDRALSRYHCVLASAAALSSAP